MPSHAPCKCKLASVFYLSTQTEAPSPCLRLDITGLDEFLECVASPANHPYPVVRIRPKRSEKGDDDDEEEDMQAYLKKICDLLLKKLELGGIPGIKKCTMDKAKRFEEDSTGSLNERNNYPEEWTLITEGSALLSVMSVEGVDHRRVKCNHITEIYEVSTAAHACAHTVHTPVRYGIHPGLPM
jgi:hypothetical protein